jgi:hypothetical protein
MYNTSRQRSDARSSYREKSNRSSNRAYRSSHERGSRDVRGFSRSSRRYVYHRARRFHWPRVSVHVYPSFLPYYRHGYFWSAGYYYPRYYFDYAICPDRAALRVQAYPPETEVYVDGYYAGIVDDFDGFFQRLYVRPGPHEITLRLNGFRTWSAEIYAAPDSTLKLHHEMVPGAVAEAEIEPYADQPGDEPPPYEEGDEY